MNRNDRLTIMFGLIALLAVLAVTVPASAMNDPVTGRWISRDPLQYNAGDLPGAVADSQRVNDPTANVPANILRKSGASRDAFEPQLRLAWQQVSPTSGGSLNSYLLLRSRPAVTRDPGGTEVYDPDCPTGIEFARETTTEPWNPSEPPGCSDARGTRTTIATVTCTTMTLEITMTITEGCEGICGESCSRRHRPPVFGYCVIVTATRTDVFNERLPTVTVISREDGCYCCRRLPMKPA